MFACMEYMYVCIGLPMIYCRATAQWNQIHGNSTTGHTVPAKTLNTHTRTHTHKKTHTYKLNWNTVHLFTPHFVHSVTVATCPYHVIGQWEKKAHSVLSSPVVVYKTQTNTHIRTNNEHFCTINFLPKSDSRTSSSPHHNMILEEVGKVIHVKCLEQFV